MYAHVLNDAAVDLRTALCALPEAAAWDLGRRYRFVSTLDTGIATNRVWVRFVIIAHVGIAINRVWVRFVITLHVGITVNRVCDAH